MATIEESSAASNEGRKTDSNPPDSNRERNFVKLSDRQGPILHESLPPELLTEIRDVYEQIGRYVKPTLEEFELGFMRDPLVGREVLVWKCIAKAWADYKGDKLATDDEAVKCITAMTLISMAVTDAKRLKVPDDVAARLTECFNKAWNEKGAVLMLLCIGTKGHFLRA